MAAKVGMDQCEKCGGTGRVLKANSKTFPDTREGYNQAQVELDATQQGADYAQDWQGGFVDG